ncbi:MAG: HAD-IB family phosphatase, partial [Epsilonproteobacteria bacterium]|nr:HAD-IB family phosphatase [Campylobacterota bacterium]
GILRMTADKCKYCYRDFKFKKQNNSKKTDNVKLVVFDMDGVLVDIYSSWKYVHDYFNTSNEKSVEAYLKGEINDMEFIKRDATLWKENGKPIKKEKLAKILSDVPLMPGAKECINTLHDKNIKTAIVSAGLDVLSQRVGKELGVEHIYSNGIQVDEHGYLTDKGILNVKLIYKDEAVNHLSKALKIPLDRIAAVGNSCFDISMFEVAGLGIAFNPSDECTKKYADHVVIGKNLELILDLL